MSQRGAICIGGNGLLMPLHLVAHFFYSRDQFSWLGWGSADQFLWNATQPGLQIFLLSLCRLPYNVSRASSGCWGWSSQRFIYSGWLGGLLTLMGTRICCWTETESQVLVVLVNSTAGASAIGKGPGSVNLEDLWDVAAEKASARKSPGAESAKGWTVSGDGADGDLESSGHRTVGRRFCPGDGETGQRKSLGSGDREVWTQWLAKLWPSLWWPLTICAGAPPTPKTLVVPPWGLELGMLPPELPSPLVLQRFFCIYMDTVSGIDSFICPASLVVPVLFPTDSLSEQNDAASDAAASSWKSSSSYSPLYPDSVCSWFPSFNHCSLAFHHHSLLSDWCALQCSWNSMISGFCCTRNSPYQSLGVKPHIVWNIQAFQGVLLSSMLGYWFHGSASANLGCIWWFHGLRPCEPTRCKASARANHSWLHLPLWSSSV